MYVCKYKRLHHRPSSFMIVMMLILIRSSMLFVKTKAFGEWEDRKAIYMAVDG